MASPGGPGSSPSSSRKQYASGKKDSLACDQRAFPKTPTKKSTITKPEVLSDYDQSDTVRKRRGFRPLSVLTTSAFYPFESDTLHAMDAVISEEKDTTSPAVRPGSEARTQHQDKRSSSDKDTQQDSDDYNEGTPSASRLYHNQIGCSSTSSLVTVKSTEDAEISLAEFLKTTSPSVPTIKADYTSLLDLPAPDPSEHPAFQSSPFSCRSGGPNLETTTSADSIRKIAAESRKSYTLSIGPRASTSSETPRSAEKRRFFPFDSFKTPEPLQKRSSKSPLDSPLSKKYRPIEIPPMSARTSYSDDGESKRTGSGGLRKFSDIFRSRTSVDTIPEDDDSSSPISFSFNDSPFDHRAKLVSVK